MQMVNRSSPSLTSEEEIGEAEIGTPMMADEQHIFDKPSLTQVIERVLNEPGPEGIVVTPSEAIVEEAP